MTRACLFFLVSTTGNLATPVPLRYQPTSAPRRQKDNFLEAAEWGVANGNEG